MNEKNNLSIHDDGRVVLLPCEPEHFKEFISGLLGRPQQISRYIDSAFEISKDDVYNLYHLLKQRIEKQNQGILISFAANVTYDDGSTVTTNDLEDFISYAEIRPIVPEQINLSWIWLIKFAGSDVPEKQEIDVTFVTNGRRRREGYISVEFDSPKRVLRPESGIFSRINHTDRSWGVDIDGLIVGFIKNVQKKHGPVKAALSKYAWLFGLLSGVSVCFTGLYSIISIIGAIYAHRFMSIEAGWSKSIHTNDQLYLQKIDYIVDHISKSYITFSNVIEFSTYVVVIFLSVAFGIFAGELAGEPLNSYILFSKQSELKKEGDNASVRKSIMRYAFAGIGSLIVAIVARVSSAALVSALGLAAP